MREGTGSPSMFFSERDAPEGSIEGLVGGVSVSWGPEFLYFFAC